MLERVLSLLVILGALFAVAYLVRWYTRRRRNEATGQVVPDRLHTEFPTDSTGIIYFFGPHCGSCRRQAMILDQLAREDMVPIARIDASVEDELARQFAVMTVPATVIVGPGRRVHAINLGLQTGERLSTQLRALSA